MYLHGPVLFACDYAFPPGPGMRLNPYSDKDEIRARGRRVADLMAARAESLETVCGYNYVTDFASYRRDFERILEAA